MTKFFSFFIILSSSLVFLASIALYLNYQPQTGREGVGKYALGSCKSDSDCFIGGCSNEYCTSRKDLLSTCIFSEDFPDKKIYSCGCVGRKCAWFKK